MIPAARSGVVTRTSLLPGGPPPTPPSPPITPSDFVALIEDSVGGQRITVADGTYSIRDVAASSVGSNRTDWLILEAETQGGVTLVAEGAGTTKEQHQFLIQNQKKLVLSGFVMDGIVTYLDNNCLDVLFWYDDFSYMTSEHPDNLSSSGSYTPSGIIANDTSNERLTIAGCDVGPVSDDALRISRMTDLRVLGTKIGPAYSDGTDPGYHEDLFQTVGSLVAGAETYGAYFEGCDFFGRQPRTSYTDFMRLILQIENGGGSATIGFKDCWFHDTHIQNVIQYAVKSGPGEAQTGATLAITFISGNYAWNIHSSGTGTVLAPGENGEGGYTITTTGLTQYTDPSAGTNPADVWRAVVGQRYQDLATFLGVGF